MGMTRVIMIQTVFFSRSIHQPPNQSPNQSYLLACAQRCKTRISPTEVGFETSRREIYWKSGNIIMLKASYFLAGKEHLCRRANYEEPFRWRKPSVFRKDTEHKLPGYLFWSTSTPPEIDTPNILIPDLICDPTIFCKNIFFVRYLILSFIIYMF